MSQTLVRGSTQLRRTLVLSDYAAANSGKNIKAELIQGFIPLFLPFGKHFNGIGAIKALHR